MLRDNTFRRNSLNDGNNIIKVDKKEKIILESLSTRVNELEYEN